MFENTPIVIFVSHMVVIPTKPKSQALAEFISPAPNNPHLPAFFAHRPPISVAIQVFEQSCMSLDWVVLPSPHFVLVSSQSRRTQSRPTRKTGYRSWTHTIHDVMMSIIHMGSPRQHIARCEAKRSSATLARYRSILGTAARWNVSLDVRSIFSQPRVQHVSDWLLTTMIP